ncbi:MAG: hypothetical protein ACYCX3_06260 [Thermoleophilia bacterium]
MNLIVLVVAGVFVAAGLVLIVLSFLVGRSRPPKGASETPGNPASPAAEIDASAFIDEPLATDIVEQLQTRKKPRTAEEPTSDVEPNQGAATAPRSEEQQPAPAQEAAVESDAPASVALVEPPTPTTVANQVGFNFRVQLGFKFLQNGLYQDGVAEFQKALSLTDDPDAKLKLYVEIGNAFRSQEMFGPASAAYLQATSYTDNGMLLEHLERTIAELTGTDDRVGAADSASGPKKEE